MARTLRLEEADGRWTELELVEDHHAALLQAAIGVVACSPESDGRARALERLGASDWDAYCLAAQIMRAVLS